MTEARIIGPSSELGFFDTLDFFGNPLTREFSEINVSPDELRKLQANRFVEVKGAAQSGNPFADQEAAEQAQRDADQTASIKARLDELGVEYAPRANLKTLQGALDKAEKAKAAQDEEEAEALAEAERIQAEQAQ